MPLGERAYNNCNASVFSSNPYKFGVLSPYDPWSTTNSYSMYAARAVLDARRYTISVRQTIGLNASLNDQAQRNVDKMEPQTSIWEEDEPLSDNMASMSLEKGEKGEKGRIGGEVSAGPSQPTPQEQKRASKSWFKKTFSSEHRALAKQEKQKARDVALRNSILYEENGRWPSAEWRQLVDDYQQKVGMKRKIAELRARQPLQYSHLLRAGYFEPIPVAWADQISNPLKFSIESTEGWRGITPAWRGYEDTAEERLYWVLNHREGSLGPRLKPDQISALNMALERMSRAVEPPPQYFSSNDTCHVQHTSKGYSRQVMAAPFMAYDQPETALDDTMILLDVSGSMDFDPMRPVYNQYLITGYDHSTQPKNKDVARAIVRRFVDAMINHSRNGTGYDLTTFANHAEYVGVINHRNFDRVWGNVRLGGGTRVMTGWQKVKQRHFEKHSASATYHPVYGWQAGPQTPMLRLLLLLDGEATDMDEFELDLLGNSWAHVTIFLIGVDGCPHHHRHANELQRISEVNHHVSFVDAQGNTPERLVTHELLKRHLGYDVSMAEFEELEQPPPYSEM